MVSSVYTFCLGTLIYSCYNFIYHIFESITIVTRQLRAPFTHPSLSASEGTFSENAHTLNLKDKKLGLTKVLEKIHEANIELLHTLILSNCDLDLDSLTELLRVFGQLSALKVLDLSKNPFGDKGAAVIIEWMKTNKTITSLSLVCFKSQLIFAILRLLDCKKDSNTRKKI